ncbi:uncharacterized mitochondrial protein AtMg00810-like [Beta vulgaris subsp. vulgaris]|uniref:uncharacterized mitochondrial protein AtMg00810-like n=1 Tax=Beta vulgaris subsp. vulgaris TaxID=3555 RepID=UPI00254974AD|nr:uncharacterized mitochondrial protein AtMg00810-like [Beta vulgaris subsp. vulgaris]
MAYLLLYVDDIILTASSDTLLQSIISKLSSEFAMKDLGALSYFLGVVVTRHAGGLFVSQRKYAAEIIDRAGMSSCKPSSTPVDTKPKLSSTSSAPYADPSYIAVCLYMHDPREAHMLALKRIVRYLQGNLDHGLYLYPSSVSKLIAYTDADWGGGVLIPAGLLRAIVFSWNLLLELHCPIPTATLIYCDNVSAIYLSGKPVQHQRTKHIEMDIHFVREKVARGQV